MTWWEFGVLKISAVSAGILLGVYFYNALYKLNTLFWITCLGLGLVLVCRIWLGKRH